jgi:hypothetical protein
MQTAGLMLRAINAPCASGIKEQIVNGTVACTVKTDAVNYRERHGCASTRCSRRAPLKAVWFRMQLIGSRSQGYGIKLITRPGNSQAVRLVKVLPGSSEPPNGSYHPTSQATAMQRKPRSHHRRASGHIKNRPTGYCAIGQSQPRPKPALIHKRFPARECKAICASQWPFLRQPISTPATPGCLRIP